VILLQVAKTGKPESRTNPTNQPNPYTAGVVLGYIVFALARLNNNQTSVADHRQFSTINPINYLTNCLNAVCVQVPEQVA
jgi:hypothetical protein